MFCSRIYPPEAHPDERRDDFRIFRWLHGLDNLDDILEESRYLLEI